MRSPKAPRRRAVIFRSQGLLQIKQGTQRRLRSASVGAGQTSTRRFAPLRWLPPATLLWTCHLGTPCVASCSQPTSFIKYAIFCAGQTSTRRFAPLRWLPPATLLWTCHLGTPCVASCSQPTSFIKYAIFLISNTVY